KMVAAVAAEAAAVDAVNDFIRLRGGNAQGAASRPVNVPHRFGAPQAVTKLIRPVHDGGEVSGRRSLTHSVRHASRGRTTPIQRPPNSARMAPVSCTLNRIASRANTSITRARLSTSTFIEYRPSLRKFAGRVQTVLNKPDG